MGHRSHAGSCQRNVAFRIIAREVYNSVDPKKTREALLGKFRQICTERINRLLDMFSNIHETYQDQDKVDAFMREIHTLKGELRLMGFPQSGKVVHCLEDNLKALRGQNFLEANMFQESFTQGLDVVSNNVLHDVAVNAETLCKKISAWTESDAVSQSHQLVINKTQRQEKKSISSIAEIVRVSGAKLDTMGNMVGDLFTAYLRMSDLLSMVDGFFSDIHRLNATIKHLQSNPFAILPGDLHPVWHTQRLNHKLAEFRRSYQDRISGFATSLDQLIEHMRQFRLMPISSLFELYPAAIRELARERGKQVTVQVLGGDTLADRSILDALGEIILHLIRNAVDHGIEDPDQRQKSGKSKSGNLILRAMQSGDRIIIEVKDDGQGIDIEKIKQTAIEKGIMTKRELETADIQYIVDLIFRPGFSTSTKTTEISGRGIGLDVVRSKVHELGGTIEATFRPQQGSCFSVEMPTSIAIVRVLLFRSDEQTFALMATYVDRVEKLKSFRIIESTTGRAVVQDGRTIPIVHCAELLHTGSAFEEDADTPLMICRQGSKRLGILVDEVLGERELTLKPLGQYLSGMRSISGATTLEDGSVVLVLHAGHLIEGMGKKTSSLKKLSSTLDEKIQRVLLVEDSLITRELEKSVLSSIGLNVEEAQDGMEALEKLNQADFDLVVADVEMPRLDGFELTIRIKQDNRWSHIPVILVTTLGGDEDRRRGVEAGADAYLVKSEFDNKSFIDTILRHLQ